MSQENVELTQRAYDAFNQRDQEAFLALMDDEVKTESRLAAMEGGYRGREGARRWWNDLLGMLPDYSIEAREMRDLGDVILVHIHARATPVVDVRWQAIRWRDGKCVWWSIYSTEEEALEAVGLRE